jgi:hypothetical protein
MMHRYTIYIYIIISIVSISPPLSLAKKIIREKKIKRNTLIYMDNIDYIVKY